MPDLACPTIYLYRQPSTHVDIIRIDVSPKYAPRISNKISHLAFSIE